MPSNKLGNFKDRFAASNLSRSIDSHYKNSVQQENSSLQNISSELMSTHSLTGALVVPISDVVRNKNQVRQYFDPEALEELSRDIAVRGILEPLIVRLDENGNYEIIAGERRFRAAQQAGLTELPVIVREMDDEEARLVMLVENIQRQDLDPKDEQAFYLILQNDFNLSIPEIAGIVHKSSSYIKRRLYNELESLQPASQTSNPANLASSEETTDVESEEISLIGNKQLEGSRNKAMRLNSENATIKKKPQIDTSFKKVNKTLKSTLELFQENRLTDDKEIQQVLAQLSQIEDYISQIRSQLPLPKKKR